MFRRLQKRLSYSNVLATTALFIALGGTSYAAITLPRNSVGNVQLRDNAVTGREVRDRSLGVRELNLLAREALRGERGPAGPAGPAGGTPGTPGAAELVFTYKTQAASIGAGSEQTQAFATASVQCDPGQRVTGGGTKLSGTSMFLIDSYPSSSTAWTVRAMNDGGAQTFTVYAICTAGTG